MNGWLECAVNTYPFMKNFFLLLVLGAFSAGQFAGAQDFPQQPVPKFLSPEESQKLFQLPEGYSLEPVLTEPHIKEPAVAGSSR